MSRNGTYTDADGVAYVGEWVADKREGHGTRTYANGATYVGEWVAGKEEGHGTRTYPNGAAYVGHYVAGKKEGHGTKTYASGRVSYDGQWLEGKIDRGGIRTLLRLQRKRDEIWARRRDWMITITPFIRGEEFTESPIQKAVFNIPGIHRHVTSLL